MASPSLYAAEEELPLSPDQQLPSTSTEKPHHLPSRTHAEVESADFFRSVPSTGSSYTNGAHFHPYIQPLNTHCRGKKLADPLSEAKPSVHPAHDRNVYSDERVLLNLCTRQRLGRRDVLDYFQLTQMEIKPHMRKMVVEWMSDVCTEEDVDPEVFALAVGYLDRFLSVQPVFKKQFQGLAAACIFIASKVKQPVPLTASRVASYTDNSVTVGELISWELLVLSKLNWDVSSVTALDFEEHILARLLLPSALISKMRPVIITVVSSMLKDFAYALWTPSMQASVAVCLAGVLCLQDRSTISQFVAGVATVLQADQDQLALCVKRVESSLMVSEIEGKDTQLTESSGIMIAVNQSILYGV